MHLTPPVHRAEGHGGTALLGMILLNNRRKEIEMIRFSGIDFLPVDPVNVGFIPVHVEFRKGKIPRLVDCDGNRIAAWRLP